MANTLPSANNDNNGLDLRRFFRSVKRLRWVYLASFILFMGLAVTYCLIKHTQYKVQATILIESGTPEGGADGMANMMRTFSVGGFGASSVNNELQLISSHDVLMNTARALGLNRNYIRRDGLGKEMLFLDAPIAVEAPQQMMDTLSRAMKISVEILEGGKADITVTRGMLGRVIGEKEGATLPAVVQTELGPLTILKTDNFTGRPETIDVSFGSYEAAAEGLFKQIEVSTPDKLADAIAFEYLYPNRERGRAIINTVMAEYQAKRLDRKHSTARTQLEFFDERLNELSGQLAEAELKVEQFRNKHKLFSPGNEVEALIDYSTSTEAGLVGAKSNLKYYDEIIEILNSPDSDKQLLPIFSTEAYDIVRDYNNALLGLASLEQSAKDDNPVLIRYKHNLESNRAIVVDKINSIRATTQRNIEAQEKKINEAKNRLAQLPATERQYAEVIRDRQLKGELYSYLATQREQAMLQLYNQETLGFIVDEAYTAIKPSKKKAFIAIVACLFMAIFCPTCLALWLTWRNRRITEPMDTARFGIEDVTRVLDGSKASANALRTLVMESAPNAALYVSGPSAGEVIESLAGSFGAIDRQTALLDPEDMGLQADNDSLFLPKFRQRLADILADGRTAATMIEVPDADRVAELAPLLDACPEASLLLAYPAGALTTPVLGRIVRSIPPERIILAITPDKD